VIERYGAPRAFDGGLRITTTLDLELQHAAEQAVTDNLPDAEDPSAAIVVIENSTGDVRAMVGGRNYDESPFNLATQGQRQPGSSFKAFDLAAALERGISPDSVWPSKEKTFYVHGPGGVEKFVVHNDEGAYTGENTLTGALAYSDNSIFAEVGLEVGTKRIALLAHRMGITTPLSTNPAMTIGGLTIGVTPLDMAHAYETIAHGGEHVSGSLVEGGAPVGIQQVQAGASQPLPNGSRVETNKVLTHRVLPASVAETETSMLETVLEYGTGKAAAIGQFAAGKTGTTSNYGDAWFVGWDSKFTVAVWVGYANKLIPMTTEFDDGPVLGGTFPALIWHDFMVSALQIEKERAEHSAVKKGASGSTGEVSSTSTPEVSSGPVTPPLSSSKTTSPAPGTAKGGATAPSTGTPEAGGETHAPEHAAAPATPPTTEPAPATSAPATPAPTTPPATTTPSATGGVGAPG
jgi:penicillin-binding protein 1A